MYGFDEDLDTSAFVGRTLSSVKFAENLIMLAFDEEVVVTVLGSVWYRLTADGPEEVDSPPVQASSLVLLIGGVVATCTRVSVRELLLQLDAGGSLRFYDDLPNYETYSIRTSNYEIFV